MQKIRSSAYTSLSVFGLLFTAVIGFTITLVSYILEPVCSCLHKKGLYNQYAYLEWTANTTLQLQRLAHEGIKSGSWSQGTKTIPMTRNNDLLGCLDIENPKHPVLRPPRTSSATESRKIFLTAEELSAMSVGADSYPSTGSPARIWRTEDTKSAQIHRPGLY